MLTPFGTVLGGSGGSTSLISSVGNGLSIYNGKLACNFDTKAIAYVDVETRDPLTTDYRDPSNLTKNYKLGQLWLNSTNGKIFILSALIDTTATWKEIGNQITQISDTISVDEVENSIVKRDWFGSGHFYEVFINALKDSTYKCLKIQPNGSLLATQIFAEDINSAINLNIQNLRINALTAGYLKTDASGNVSASALTLPTTQTIDVINSNGNLQIPSGIATDALNELTVGNGVACYNQMKMHNGIKTNTITSYNTTYITIDKQLKLTDAAYGTGNTILGRNGTTGELTLFSYGSSNSPSAIVQRDSSSNITCSGLISNSITPITGAITMNSDVIIKNGKELSWAMGNDEITENYDESKIVLYDRRQNGTKPAYWFGIGMRPKMIWDVANSKYVYGSLADAGSIMFHSRSAARPFQFIVGTGDDINDTLQCEIINDTLKIKAVAALDGTTNLTLASPLKLTASTYTTTGYLYRNTDGTTSIQTPGISSETVDTNSTANTLVKRDENKYIHAERLYTNSISPETAATTPSGVASGTVNVNGDILIKGGNELRFEQGGTPSLERDTSKIVFFDDRAANQYKYYSVGTNILQKNSSFGMVFHSGGLNRGFEWSGMNTDDLTATGDVAHMALINKILYINSIDKYDGTTLELKPSLKLSGYSTNSGYLYRNSDGTTTIQTPSAATTMSYSAVANTGVLRDADKNIEMDGLIKYPNGGYMKNSDIRVHNENFKIEYEGLYGHTQNIIKYTDELTSIFTDSELDNAWNNTNRLPIYKIEIGKKWVDAPAIDGGFINQTFIHGIWANLPSAAGGYGPVYCNADGSLNTPGSSRRFKKDIVDLDNSERIYNMRPVKFFYKNDVNCENLEYGLIAEELQELGYNDLVLFNNDKVYSVKYQHIPILTLKEVQKLKQENDSLKQQVCNLSTQMAELTQQMQTMQEQQKSFVKFSVVYPPQITQGSMTIYESGNDVLNAVWKTTAQTKKEVQLN